MTGVLLFDLSSRVWSPISVHSPVFPWIVEHATDMLPGISLGSGVKRAHSDSIVTDDDEQSGTRARLPALITGSHGVNAAEDDEICSGYGINDEWLSSWNPETHVSQKMVIEAERMEMDRFKRMKVYRVVTRESTGRDEEGKMISIKGVVTN